MEIFEPLPFNLKSKFRQDITPAVRQSLEHLWKSAHAIRSVHISHTFMRQFRALVDEHGVDLPHYVNDKICQWCAALMLPSVTCRIRVKRLERKSRAQRKLLALNAPAGKGKEQNGTAASAKLKNCLVVTCLVCDHTAAVLPGCKRRPLPSTSTDDSGLTPGNTTASSSSSKAISHGNSSTPSNSRTGTGAGAGAGIGVAGQSKKRFSFLDSLDRRSSAPGRLNGDFIALGSPMMPPYPPSSSTSSSSYSASVSVSYSQVKSPSGHLKNSAVLKSKSIGTNSSSSSKYLKATSSAVRTTGDAFDCAIDVTYTIDGAAGGGSDEVVATATSTSATTAASFISTDEMAAVDSATLGAKRTSVNLLDLEKRNKKEQQQKRRKTLGGYVGTTSTSTSAAAFTSTSNTTSAARLPVTPKTPSSFAATMNQMRGSGTPKSGGYSSNSSRLSGGKMGVPSPAPSLGTLQGLLSRKKT